MPWLTLDAWPEGTVNLRRRWLPRQSAIISTLPGSPVVAGTVERNAARLHAWERHETTFVELGYDVAFLSSRPLAEQQEWITSDSFPYTLLSDVEMHVASAIPVPTVTSGSRKDYEDLTFIVEIGEINQVFYSSREPPNDVETVVSFIRKVRDRRR
jgi:hypothetical protein